MNGKRKDGCLCKRQESLEYKPLRLQAMLKGNSLEQQQDSAEQLQQRCLNEVESIIILLFCWDFFFFSITAGTSPPPPLDCCLVSTPEFDLC